MSQTWRGQAIVESSGFVAETPTLDTAVQVRRTVDESITGYLKRLSDIETRVASGKLKLQPELVEDEICSWLLFEFNEWTLTPESYNIIDKKLASWLRMHPHIEKAGLIAEGWADSVGSDEACQKVSLKRARNVAEFITSSLGVQVTAIGKGKSTHSPNDTEKNKQKNRRVVIKRR